MGEAIGSTERKELEAGLESLQLDRALAEPLLAYLALLLRWNAAYNLTAIRDPREMVAKHLLDSLAMHAATAPLAAAGGSLADLATGAGFPGIPLAIAQPGLQVALVESNGKKARFLREAVRSLGLANATLNIANDDPSISFSAAMMGAKSTLPKPGPLRFSSLA